MRRDKGGKEEGKMMDKKEWKGQIPSIFCYLELFKV